MFILLLFTSVVSANSDNNMENNTNKIIKKDKINVEEIQEKSIKKEDKVQIKNAKNTNQKKHKTTTSLKTTTNGSHIILDATIKSDVVVDEGYVIYKLNGATLKKDNQNIKVNVVNSRAILSLPVSNYNRLYSTSEAVYSGNDLFMKSRNYINNTDLYVHDTTTSLVTSTDNTHITLKATVKSDIPVYTGYVIYKFNQITLKDASEKNYKVKVSNSKAELSLPLSEYRRLYSNSQAVYSGSAMYHSSRTFNNKAINLRLNPEIKIVTDKSSYEPGENVSMNIQLSHRETNNFTDGKVSLKINGVSLKNDNDEVLIYRIKGNSVNVKFPIQKGMKYNHVNITVTSEGRNYNQISATKKINLIPLNTKIVVTKNFLDNNNNYLITATLKDKYNENVIGKRFVDCLVDNNKVKINNKSKVYTIINGKIKLKIPLDQYKKGSHTLQLKLRSDNAYNSSASPLYNIELTKKYPTKIIIDTPQKAKNASQINLRVYVTYDENSILKTINTGRVSIKINNQVLTSNVNYGKAVISYKLPSKTGTYNIKVYYNGINDLKDSSANKDIILTSDSISSSESAILGNKDPNKEKISFNSAGVPNLIYMTNYVWADGDATYTLSKSQLEEVFKQDSYSLYLNGHMSKYVAFKTINESNIYHVLKREKWNVIEKAANKIRVKSSKGSLPDSMTVSLKGKQYIYGEARAIQSTGYTCGPTAASVCTQSLRNYVNEDTLATEFKTYKYRGTYASNIPGSMKSHNMHAEYYYKSNFDSALSKVAGGGYAFIFYGVNHYVSILDVSKDKSKVLVSNSYGDYSMGGGKIPNGWVSVSFMKNRFSSDSFAGLLVSLSYSLSSDTKTRVNNLYNNFGSNWIRQNTNEELNV